MGWPRSQMLPKINTKYVISQITTFQSYIRFLIYSNSKFFIILNQDKVHKIQTEIIFTKAFPMSSGREGTLAMSTFFIATTSRGKILLTFSE